MVVGIDARELCHRPAGKGQYLARLISSWYAQGSFPMVFYIQADQELPASLFPEREGERPPIKIVKQRGKGPLWHRAVGRRLKDDGVTVFFAALTYQSAIWNQVPTVTVVHDLAIFKLPTITHNRKAQIVERLTLEACAERSKRIIAVSESTKNDLVQVAGVAAERIDVILEAAMLTERMSGGEEIKPLPWSERGKYLLFVGTLEPRKNVSTLLRAYAALPDHLRSAYSLRLAGKPGWGGEDYPGLARELGIEDRVEFMGYVADDAMYDLYRKAALFAYPSWYEGFGLPVIEAMSVGTPVVTSDRSSLPEVVGDTGRICDPSDALSISQAMEVMLSNARQFSEQSKAAFERSKLFSWKSISADIAAVLRETTIS